MKIQIKAEGRKVMAKVEYCNKCGFIKQQCECLEPMTNADRIRANSDLFMSVQIAGCIVSYLVQCKIIEGTEADHKGLISGIADDILEWLQEKAEASDGTNLL